MKILLATIALVCATSACGKKGDAPANPAGSERPVPPTPPPAPDATATPVDAVATRDAAVAADTNPRTSEFCAQVLAKIVACQHDKHFIEALDEGVDAKRRALNKRHLTQIVKWNYSDCTALPTAIEDGGFLDHWDLVTAVPSALDSCGKLGTTLNSAGGLFGGDVAN